MSNFKLETPRLLLREFALHDYPLIIELVNSPGWIKFIGDRHIKTELEAKAYIHNGPLKSYEENGFGLYLVELKDHTPMGMCGLIKRENLEHPDIGFALLPAFIGKGYGFEAAWAVLNYGKDTLKLSAILAITVPHNITSVKLIGKLGLKLVKSFCFNGSDEELNLYTT